MNNKKNLQILFFAVLVLGIVLTPFKDTRPFGFILLCLLQPVIGLHYITQIKKSESVENTRLVFRYPLLIALQLTFIVLLIRLFFMAMHWPFVSIVQAVIYGISIITFLMAIVFIVLNRKIIHSIFVLEFILLIMPVFFLMSFVLPANYNGTEYSDLLKKRYEDLSQIEDILYQNVKKDTMTSLTIIDIIDDIKKRTIVQYGGLNEDGTLKGAKSRIDFKYVENDLKKIKNDSLTHSIIRQHPSYVIEYLSCLTKLQIDLLLKEKK